MARTVPADVSAMPGTPVTTLARRGLFPGAAGGRGHLWLLCLVLITAILTSGGLVIWDLRKSALASVERELTNLGVALAEQTSRNIQAVDLILQEMQLSTSALGLRTCEQFNADMSREATHKFLADRRQNLPQAEVIGVLDADGALLNWSRPAAVPTLNFADRAYFRRLRDDPHANLVIGGPQQGRVSGNWSMFVARRINGPDGTFFGVMVSLLSTNYLEEFYRTVSMVPGESVTVLRRDGVVIAGQPNIASRRGKLMPPQSPWYDRVARGGGSYRSPGYVAPVPTIVTVHPLREYPLVVDMNMSEQAAFKAWRGQTIGIALVMLVAMLGCVALFWVIAAQFRRQAAQNLRLQQSEAALRRSEHRLTVFARMSADWFWEQDAELRFVRDADIPMTSLPSDVGKTRWDFADPAMSPHRWEAHKADLAARRPFRNFRWERIRTDGRRCYMSTNGDPMFDEAGNFIGYIGTGRDITSDVEAAEELRRAKERAEAASRAKSAFLANMSHELRTPLNAIIGFGELIRDVRGGEQGGNKTAEWAGDIVASGRHLLNVVNNVLELSRLETGRYELADDRIDLATVVRFCLGIVRRHAEERDVQVHCAIADRTAVLRADLRAVKQVVTNLLSNAVKFTQAGGVVAVRAEQDENGDIVLVVADNGVGIEQAALESLCEPFTQADMSPSRKHEGSGLGLAISRKLVGLLGGTLRIDSVPGQGTTVRVVFPAARVVADRRQAGTTPRTAT